MIKPPKDPKEFYDRLAAEDIENDIVSAYYRNIQRDKLLKFCGNAEGLSVLDVGIGKDSILCYLKGCCRRVGVDIAEIYLKRLPAGIERWSGYAENMPYDKEFDLIICSDVLEHVLDAGKLLRAIGRALKPSGKVVIKVPYKENLEKYIGAKWEGCHLRTFDENSLSNLLQTNGFSILKASYSGFDINNHRYYGSRFMRMVYMWTAITHTRGALNILVCKQPFWIANRLGFNPQEISVIARKR